MILVPGSHLGPFEIIALIAKGGMGEVYRALDPRLGREGRDQSVRGQFSHCDSSSRTSSSEIDAYAGSRPTLAS